MKTKLIYAILMVAAIIIASCKKDEEAPKTPPAVTTAAATNVTISTATVGGEITSDGNVTVTSSGVVYSKIVAEPTLGDDKKEVGVNKGAFTASLTNLTSGSTYHVRAYATNSLGTAYGTVVNFTTGNSAPTATSISITGTVEANKTLTATYTYVDSENDVEATSTYKWYVATDGVGTGETAIAGATTKTYLIQASDQGKYIRFGVTPVAATGNTAGIEVKSSFVGAVGDATTVTFTYNGQTVTYGIIISPTSGRKWLDRNLGASSVATAVDNFVNYGDLFQWGRGADGHQLIVRTGINDADMSPVNGPTLATPPFEFSNVDNPATSKFFINDGGEPADWRKPQNSNLWQGVSGTNNPCPSGWRIPTMAEWHSENLTTLTDGYSKLKLTYTGARSGNSGNIIVSTSNAFYWSSTVDDTTPTWLKSIAARFSPAFTDFTTSRFIGLSCRCIKN